MATIVNISLTFSLRKGKKNCAPRRMHSLNTDQAAVLFAEILEFICDELYLSSDDDLY